MTSIIVNQNYGHNLIKYFEYVKQKKKAREIIARAVHLWCRGTEFDAPEFYPSRRAYEHRANNYYIRGVLGRHLWILFIILIKGVFVTP